MQTETKNLYTATPKIIEAEEQTREKELKTALVLFETDEGKIVTYDEFRGVKPIEEEPAEAVVEDTAEQKSYEPALYPLFNQKHEPKEQYENSGYTQAIVKFIDGANPETKN